MRQNARLKVTTLNSWKEIAQYLGRGVRTVQRWEAELLLPVHRIGNSNRGPVFAFQAELDKWMRRQAGKGWDAVRTTPAEPASDRPNHSWHPYSAAERSARLTSQTLRLLELQQAHTRLISEQVARMAHLLPAVRGRHLRQSASRPEPTGGVPSASVPQTPLRDNSTVASSPD